MRRKIGLFFIIIVILIQFIGCDKQKINNVNEEKNIINKAKMAESDIREIAYNSLNENYKLQVIDWKDATVEEAILNGNEISSSMGKYYTSYVYKISFRNSKEGVLGPLVVYIDKNSHRFLGIGLRD